MPSSRVLKSVVHNFLGTFMSRYTGFDGYWLFGFVVERSAEADVDLLEVPSAARSTPVAALRATACDRFQEQLAKAGIAVQRLSSATLQWRRSDLEPFLSVWGPRPGYHVVVEAVAVIPSGRRFRHIVREHILVHDPKLERRSGRHEYPGVGRFGRLFTGSLFLFFGLVALASATVNLVQSRWSPAPRGTWILIYRHVAGRGLPSLRLSPVANRPDPDGGLMSPLSLRLAALFFGGLARRALRASTGARPPEQPHSRHPGPSAGHPLYRHRFLTPGACSRRAEAARSNPGGAGGR